MNIDTLECAFAAQADEASDFQHCERALRENDLCWREINLLIEDAWWVLELSPGGPRRYASPTFARLWGHGAQTLYDDPQRWALALHPDDRERVLGRLDAWLAEPLLPEFEVQYRIVQADGQQRWVHDRARAQRDDTGAVQRVVGVARDITQARHDEDRLRELSERNAELEAAVKDAEAFTHSVSHDLRAPLRALDGFSLALLEDCASLVPPNGQRYLQVIRASAQKMGLLIDNLLHLSRISRHALNQRCLRTDQMVHSAWLQLEPQHRGRDIELCIDDLPDSEGDPTLLMQVWTHLLANAIKYTSRRDAACIEVGHANGEFYVRDNGAGFDMRYVHRLFGVFQRLHRAEDYEGTGMGLAIVQRIVQRHGGSVRAEGTTDRGATFYFHLGAS